VKENGPAHRGLEAEIKGPAVPRSCVHGEAERERGACPAHRDPRESGQTEHIRDVVRSRRDRRAFVAGKHRLTARQVAATSSATRSGAIGNLALKKTDDHAAVLA